MVLRSCHCTLKLIFDETNYRKFRKERFHIRCRSQVFVTNCCKYVKYALTGNLSFVEDQAMRQRIKMMRELDITDKRKLLQILLLV